MLMEKKRIYIVIKTYPQISKKYAELVCTAGVLEDGSWIRLYPVKFRQLDIEQKYPKYTWIDVNVQRNTKDFRPETYRPDITSIIVHPKPKKVDWDERRRIIFKNKKVYRNLQELIQKAKSNKTSLAIFKPAKVLDFTYEAVEPEWPEDKLQILQELSRQQSLFQSPEELEKEFRVVRKVPYKFFYKFEDDSGKQSKMMIEDWEIGMLYFNCLERANGDSKVAISKVKEKYFDKFTKTDLHFFLGTTKRNHNIAPNPFIIVGVFTPPSTNQQISIYDQLE